MHSPFVAQNFCSFGCIVFIHWDAPQPSQSLKTSPPPYSQVLYSQRPLYSLPRTSRGPCPGAIQVLLKIRSTYQATKGRRPFFHPTVDPCREELSSSCVSNRILCRILVFCRHIAPLLSLCRIYLFGFRPLLQEPLPRFLIFLFGDNILFIRLLKVHQFLPQCPGRAYARAFHSCPPPKRSS